MQNRSKKNHLLLVDSVSFLGYIEGEGSVLVLMRNGEYYGIYDKAKFNIKKLGK